MRGKGILQKTVVLVLCLLLCGIFFSLPVSAYTGINIQKPASLGIHFGSEGISFPGVTFRLYKVADMSEGAVFTLTGEFADYPVQLEGVDGINWRDMAETLSAYVIKDKIPSLKEGITDGDGQLEFLDLEVGLYLLLGEDYVGDIYVYSPMPQLFLLPYQMESDVWEYNVILAPKAEILYTGPNEETSRNVIKIWDDSGYTDKRPDKVKVQLLQDGEVYDTVTLSRYNNWKHTWEALPAGHKWNVVEVNVPEAYKVKVSKNNKTFTITNTYDKNEYAGSNPVQTPVSGTTLPKTGVLWWPVPVLAAAGTLLFFTGWWIYRNGEATDE